MSNFRILVCLVLSGFMVVAFQNCGDGFSALSGDDAFSRNVDTPPSDNPPGQAIVPSSFTFAVVESCAEAVGLPNLVSCLDSRNANDRELSQEMVDQCRTNVGEGLPDVVVCLANNDFAPAGYREPSQIDVDQCFLVVGADRLASCLYNKGVLPDTIEQAQVEFCVDQSGGSRVESCLRQNEWISDVGFLFQPDLNLCEQIFGTDQIADCLQGKQLIPASVSQADIATCIENTGGTAARVVRCLRLTGQIPKFISQAHVNRCEGLVGVMNIAACLDLNGLAEDGVGQEQIDSCLANNNDDVTRVARCLRLGGLVSNRPIPASFELCGRLVGAGGIAACLENSGLLLVGITQAEINSCLSTVPLSGLSVCLESRGVLASFTQMAGASGVAGMNCVGCHNDVARAGGYSWMNFLEVRGLLDPTDPTNAEGSRILQRMTDPNNPMPPNGMLSAAEIQKMRIWIQQGAVENY